jgi:peroxiredoxin
MRRSLYAIAAFAMLFAGAYAQRPAPTADLGKKAPDFQLRDAVTGKQYSLSQVLRAKGTKAVVVMFIATDCPVSNSYNDRMVSLAKQYGPKGVRFLAINANATEPLQKVAAHAKEHGFPFPVLKDEDSAVADAYAAQATPHVYVLDSAGVLRYRGRIDDNMNPNAVKTHDLADALNAVLAGQPVARADTKAFGCSIKRRVAQR